MSINFSKDKSTRNKSLLFLLLTIVFWVLSRYPIWLVPILGAAFFLVCGAKISFSETEPGWWTKSLGKLPWNNRPKEKVTKSGKVKQRQRMTYGRMIKWVHVALVSVLGPLFTTFCIQYIILEMEFFRRTGVSAWTLNVKLIFLIYLVLVVITNRPNIAWIITHIFFIVCAFADYFVYEFRGNEVTFGDLNTIRTGISVASEYKFSLPDRGAVAILLTIILITWIRKFSFCFLHFWDGRILALVIVLVMFPGVKSKVLRRVTQTWEKKGTYRNGFVVNFICGARDFLVVDPPSGYSLEAVQQLEEEYKEKMEKVQAAAEEETVKPTIITVMDESFADFRHIGDLKTNVEVTPFIDSLTENTVKGFTLASVFGAKTPNSEWEYMTGNSMAFMPGGSVPYQQFIKKQPMSMVSYLNSEGYTSVAMHPYYRTGWSRNTVYPKLGFDEMHFLDDGDSYFDESNIMRDYVTDQELFDKIIARFEAKGQDEKLFIMSITMQNHGGYKNEYENFTSDVYEQGGMLFTDASQYLSLIHQTDKAVENLISYFEKVDEPVEIVFFGDHYPSLSSSFVKSVNGKGLSGLTLTELEGLFDVPFFIWTNYESKETQDEQTSLDLLHTKVYEKAGLTGTPYDLFLKEFSEVIPAINARGYYSLTEKKYKHVSDASGVEAEWIRKYKILQYNNIFGKSDRSEFFFPYYENNGKEN